MPMPASALQDQRGREKPLRLSLLREELVGPNGRILGLDSEKRSMSLYDQFDFDVVELWARDKKRQPIKDPFHPDKYMEVIKHAEDNGYDALVIDGLSQLWNGPGGFLDLLNRVATQKYKGNTWAAWKDIDPIYNKFVDLLTDARLHIICTVRSKAETTQKYDESQKRNVIEKLGTNPIQRDGLEYEFTIFCRMEIDNTLIVEKTRCSAIKSAVVNCPDADFIRPVKEWLSSGAPVESEANTPDPKPAPAVQNGRQQADPELANEQVTSQQIASIEKLCERLGKPAPAVQSFSEARELIRQLTAEYKAAKASEQPAKDEPAEVKMMTQNQFEALAKLYGQLDMEMPQEEISKWSYDQASAGIKELSAKLRASKA